MALNQRQHHFSAYSSCDSEKSHAKINLEYPENKAHPKESVLFRKKNFEKSLVEKSSFSQKLMVSPNNGETAMSLMSDSKMYALKKRLLLPTWLVEGVLLALGTKEPWFDSLSCSRIGKIFACPSQLNVKALIPFFLIWNELVSKIFTSNWEESSIKLQLNKYITGTQKDIHDISKEIEHIFSSPFKISEVKPSKKPRAFSMTKMGSLNFIRHAQLENDVDGVWLTLNLTNSFRDVCYPPELKQCIDFGSSNIVSISPIVIQSMSPRANLKKVLNYLFLEFSKQESYRNQTNWNTFPVDCKKMIPFHKDMLSTAPSFYDHGALGWSNCAPNRKISELKEMNQTQHRRHEFICSWQLSDQLREANEIERSIAANIFQRSQFDCREEKQPILSGSVKKESLFLEPPVDELKRAREERRAKRIPREKERPLRTKVEEKNELSKTIFSSSTRKTAPSIESTPKLFDDGLKVKHQPEISLTKQRNPEPFFVATKPPQELPDHEFLVQVSEFYESLKPMQKRAFERDRKGMSREQFRAYMSSILQRRKSATL